MRVLLADDDPTIRCVLKSSLEKLGHLVVECESGGEVLGQMFTGNLPQLLILDWMMPHTDGLEVCRAVRERRDLPFTYIMMLTGRASPADILEGLRSGANDYVMKPVASGEFQARIQVAVQLIESNNFISQQKLAVFGTARMASLGEMATSMAHEINNPLSIIHAEAESITDRIQGVALPEPVKADVERSVNSITETVQRISRILRALQTFSKADDKEDPRSVPVQEIFEHVVALCSGRLKNDGVDLIVRPFARDISLEARPNQIVQSLLNLVDNAVHATAGLPERWIEFEVFEDPKNVYISVRDSGKGIPPEIRSRIMEPFFTTRDIGSGLGLGLSVARGCITAHGGSLRLDEGDPRTRFVLTLPKRS